MTRLCESSVISSVREHLLVHWSLQGKANMSIALGILIHCEISGAKWCWARVHEQQQELDRICCWYEGRRPGDTVMVTGTMKVMSYSTQNSHVMGLKTNTPTDDTCLIKSITSQYHDGFPAATNYPTIVLALIGKIKPLMDAQYTPHVNDVPEEIERRASIRRRYAERIPVSWKPESTKSAW